MKTKHPCHGMSRAEITAFEAIAVNHDPRCSKKTLERLLERGLIAKQDRLVHFSDGLPPSIATDFYVPLPVHIQFCEWAGEKYG